MIYFTADTHFNHANIIKYQDRPFRNVHEMNEALIANWNAVVPVKSVIYHLGDFVFAKKPEDVLKIVKRLNGQMKLIYGNHDDEKLLSKAGIEGKHLDFIKFDKQRIQLCHYAMRVWNRSHKGSWHLYGHSHGNLEEADSLSFDIGTDANNFTPVSFAEVKKRITKKLERLQESGAEPFVGQKRRWE